MAHIYVIDDSAGSRHFVAAALGRGEHTVREIEPTCLFTVLEELHREPPDLIVLDLVMPGCPGQTILRICREDPHLQNVRILLLTAHGDASLGRFLQKMGGTHYLAKPVTPAQLSECVAAMLAPDAQHDPGWDLACEGVVAVVDDSRLSRTFHAACLRKGGFRPVIIEPGELLATVQAIEAAMPQLLIADYLMQEFNGDALIRAIRARVALRDIPVLVVTAHRAEELDKVLDRLGGVDILSKPIGAEDLLARVRANLAGH